jgi:hypothetical protein
MKQMVPMETKRCIVQLVPAGRQLLLNVLENFILPLLVQQIISAVVASIFVGELYTLPLEIPEP